MAERLNLTSTQAQGAAPTHERSAEEIRQDIAARRESITETVDRLSDRVQRSFHWQTYVAEYPLVALGMAAGVGFLASRLFRPRRSPAVRMRHALAETMEDLRDRVREQLDDVLPHKSGASFGRTVKSAATAALTTYASNYVRSRLLGGGWQGDEEADYAYAPSDPTYPEHRAESRRPGENRLRDL